MPVLTGFLMKDWLSSSLSLYEIHPVQLECFREAQWSWIQRTSGSLWSNLLLEAGLLLVVYWVTYGFI